MTRSRIILTLLLLLSSGHLLLAQRQDKPNILFIAVDDLKPVLGCYGDKLVKTPNIDRLAKMGTVFMNNHCQQSVCGPTRASLMTGLRPDVTRVLDLKTKMRDMLPDVVTLPQYLISQGYTTSGVGKIYHPSCTDKQFDAPSWSIPFIVAEDKDYANGLGEPAFKHYQQTALKELALSDAKAKKDKKDVSKSSGDKKDKSKKSNEGGEEEVAAKPEKVKKGKDDDSEGSSKRGPATECLDLPDNAYEDGVTALKARQQIIALSKNAAPFFMAVGFHKPHLPFVAPKKYWDMYKEQDMPLAPFQEHAANSPFIAYTRAGELRNYTDIPEFVTKPEELLQIGLKPEKQKQLVHGYYAAVSYMDAQVGILLNTLDSLGTLNNTIIVLWGDHGWHLGDHDLWCKHTNFEQATRSPLIIAAPGIKSGKTNSPSEHLDVFPTLCNLSGLKIPTQLQGKSLKPVMQNNKASVKDFAVSQYPRRVKKDEMKTLGYTDSKLMGYSIRTEKYRYTLWINNYNSREVFSPEKIYATELYDYVKDPLEKTNVANDSKYGDIAKDLYAKLTGFLKEQEAK
jgi:arylsulfatase A-like enzyme